MTDGPKQKKTSISLRHEDIAKLAALGMTATEAVRAFCAGRGADGMPAPVQAPGIVLVDDPDQRDPSDVLPDPPPTRGHGWTFTGTLRREADGSERWVGRAMARPTSLAELQERVGDAPGPVRLSSAYVLLVAEVSS